MDNAFSVDMQSDTMDIQVFGDIGVEDNLTSESVVTKIVGSPNVKNITVRINSAGGRFYDAVAMYNALRTHGAKVTTVNEGMAASAASLLFMAGDVREVREGSLTMIHEPSIGAAGTVSDLSRAVKFLKKTKDNSIAIYASRSGKSQSDISRMMKAETYMNAQEAIDNGFATRKTDSPAVAAWVDMSDIGSVPDAFMSLVKPVSKLEKEKPEMPAKKEVATPKAEEEEVEKQSVITMTVKEYEDLKASSGNSQESETPDKPKGDEDSAVLAERKRVDHIHSMCALAGVDAVKAKGFVDNGDDLVTVSMHCMTAMQKSNPPVPGGDDSSDEDPDSKYKKEYAKAKASGIEMHSTEEEWIYSRRIDDGLLPVEKKK